MAEIPRRSFVTGVAASALAASTAAQADESNTLPTISLGKHKVTRLIAGYNPIGGYSHSVPKLSALMRDWFTPARTLDYAKYDLVRVFNELGEVHCALTVGDDVRPGTVSLAKGLWRRSTRNGFTGTALVPDSLTDIGAGACFNDARVQVASLPTA